MRKRYYFALAVVILVWGIDPVFYTFFYRYYSAAVMSSLCTFGAAIVFFILALPHLKNMKLRDLKIAVPVSLLNALGCILQRVGLQYTTPAYYAFFEHISCAVVPVALFFLTRKKPSRLMISSSVLCLFGCFVLSGVMYEGASFNVGNLLCALAGIVLGVTVAGVGAYTRETNLHIFMMIWMVTYFCTSLMLTVIFDMTGMEKMLFSREPSVLVFVLIFGLLDVGLCWMFRNEAIRHIDPVAVAVISPCAAVITGIVSVLLKTDELTPNLVIGSLMITCAVILSGFGELKKEN